MRKAGRVVAEMHAATRAAARPGVTTADLDRVARDVLERRGARSNFLNYHGFPAVICASPNNMIVHGIPGDYRLEEGDILSIDCGAIVEGYHGDAAFTMGIGAIDPAAEKLIRVTEESLWAGIEQIRAGNRLHDIGAGGPDRRRGRRLLGGPGVRRPRHRHGHARGTPGPQLLARPPGPLLKSGMVLAVEPMVNVGGPGDRPARRRLERGDRRRQPVGPLRAHHRRHRRRPGGPHRARLNCARLNCARLDCARLSLSTVRRYSGREDRPEPAAPRLDGPGRRDEAARGTMFGRSAAFWRGLALAGVPRYPSRKCRRESTSQRQGDL